MANKRVTVKVSVHGQPKRNVSLELDVPVLEVDELIDAVVAQCDNYENIGDEEDEDLYDDGVHGIDVAFEDEEEEA